MKLLGHGQTRCVFYTVSMDGVLTVEFHSFLRGSQTLNRMYAYEAMTFVDRDIIIWCGCGSVTCMWQNNIRLMHHNIYTSTIYMRNTNNRRPRVFSQAAPTCKIIIRPDENVRLVMVPRLRKRHASGSYRWREKQQTTGVDIHRCRYTNKYIYGARNCLIR